jgi:hypothetical protein
MILEIFGLFVFISFVLIYLGYYINNPLLEVLGFLFVFLLGFVVSSYNLEYQTGMVSVPGNYSFSYTAFDDSGGVIIPNVSLARFLGIFITFIGAVGIAITLWSKRLGSIGDD